LLPICCLSETLARGCKYFLKKQFPALNRRDEGTTMRLILLVAMLSTYGLSNAIAEHAGTDKDEKACIHDVTRFCRKLMHQGDFAILACLQQNRKGLKPSCRQVLIDHGQ
jgi:hypothetical protein